MTEFATEFREITTTFAASEDLRAAARALVDSQKLHSKALGSQERVLRFKGILHRLISGEITYPDAIRMTEQELPPTSSDKRVFNRQTPEKLVRTNYSRFYNHAVLEHLLTRGETRCYVPCSTEEDAGSTCSQTLAGKEHDLHRMYREHVAAFNDEQYEYRYRIPHHPNCTHVIAPSRTAKCEQALGPA